jgi:hypothetical protein
MSTCRSESDGVVISRGFYLDGVEHILSAKFCAVDGSIFLSVWNAVTVAWMQVCIGEKYIQTPVAIIIAPPINSPVLA